MIITAALRNQVRFQTNENEIKTRPAAWYFWKLPSPIIRITGSEKHLESVCRNILYFIAKYNSKHSFGTCHHIMKYWAQKS